VCIARDLSSLRDIVSRSGVSEVSVSEGDDPIWSSRQRGKKVSKLAAPTLAALDSSALE